MILKVLRVHSKIICQKANMNKLDEFFMEKIVKELDLKIYSDYEASEITIGKTHPTLQLNLIKSLFLSQRYKDDKFLSR